MLVEKHLERLTLDWPDKTRVVSGTGLTVVMAGGADVGLAAITYKAAVIGPRLAWPSPGSARD